MHPVSPTATVRYPACFRFNGPLSVNPRSGCYRFKIGERFVEFDSVTNEYRLIADFAKNK